MAEARLAVPRVNDDMEYPIRCPTGEARHTIAGDLGFHGGLVHAVAPFFGANRWPQLLLGAYKNAFRLAFAHGTIAVSPLLGAGARGVPVADAARVAATAASRWTDNDGILRFALQDIDDAHLLIDALDNNIERTSSSLKNV